MLPADKVGSTEGNIFTELDWGRIMFAIKMKTSDQFWLEWLEKYGALFLNYWNVFKYWNGSVRERHFRYCAFDANLTK